MMDKHRLQRRLARNRPQYLADVQWRVYYAGEEIGRVYARTEDEATEMAIDAWGDCGGDYTEDLSVRQDGAAP